MARGGLAAEDEVFLAEDADAGRSGDEADGDADQEGHHGDGFVVNGAAKDLVVVEEEAFEVNTFLAVLREADQKAAKGCDAHFKPEVGQGAVLLTHGTGEAEVELAPERGAAAFDGGLEACVFSL